MRINLYEYKIYSSYENLLKIKHSNPDGDDYEFWRGTVNTVHGIVSVESWLVPWLNTKREKATWLRFIINGISYNKTIYHYKKYTAKGLSHMAGKFAKECFNQTQ